MSVSDGQDVNAAVTNAAFLSRLVDSDTIGEVDLKNASYTDLISLQRIINEALSSLGISNQAATDANANVHSSNNTGIDGNDRKAALGILDALFNAATGHSHDGTAGQGPKVSAADLSNFNNLFAEFGEYTFDAASSTSIDVTSLFSGQSSGGSSSTEGVITSAPNNYVPIVEKTTGGEIEDAQGDRVFGRLTESGGTWTLSFFTNESGTETAHSLASQNIRFLYREVFTAANRPTIGANVAVYDTQSAIGDIPDASASQRGVVNTGAQTFQGAKNFLVRPTVNSNDVVDVSAAQTITFKDIDGGTASNTSRITLPKNTTAALTGLTRKEGTVFYDTTEQNFFGDNGTDIIPLGGGAGVGGGLDVWHTENFEDTLAADFTSGNNATFGVAGTFNGTLADETVSPIASTSSLKYTQASGSLNDWFKSPVISIDNKQSGNTSGITLYFTYTGDPGDIQFVFYDETGSAVLTASEDTFTTQSNPTRYATSVSIPSATTSVSWGAQVKVENIGAVLVVDDVEFSTDPFVIQNIVEESDFKAKWTGAQNVLHNATAKVTFTGATLSGNMISNFSSGTFTIPKDGLYKFATSVRWAVDATTRVTGIYWYKNGSKLNGEGSNESIVTGLGLGDYRSESSLEDFLVEGDTIEVYVFLNTNGASVNLIEANLSASTIEESPALITPAKSPRTYSQAAGDFTITGTNWTTTGSEAVYYRTSDGEDRVQFNITGSVSVATGTVTLTFSGVTFKNISGFNQAISASTGSGVGNGRVDPNASTFNINSTATTTLWRASGDVALESRPTWADPVSSNFLAAIPEDLGVKPALYTFSAAQNLNNGVTTKLNYGAVVTDQDNLVSNPTTDWKYTAPKDGVYEIDAGVYLQTIDFDSTEVVNMRIRVNGATQEYLYYNHKDSTKSVGDEHFAKGSLKKYLSKGDEVEIVVFHNTGSTVLASNNTVFSYVSITREQTPVSFGGDIRQEKVTLDATGSGNMTGGTAVVSRVGNHVSVTVTLAMTHASNANPQTAASFLPSWATPSENRSVLYHQDSGFVYRFFASSDGRMNFNFKDWAGNDTPRVNTGSTFTHTYYVD